MITLLSSITITLGDIDEQNLEYALEIKTAKSLAKLETKTYY